MAGSACILLNGDFPPINVLSEQISRGELLICADGAYNELSEHLIQPHIILGDMDSLDRNVPETVEVIPVRTQHNNDLAKCLEYCISHDLDRVVILGFDGKRMDHFLVNMAVFQKYLPKFSRMELISKDFYCRFLTPGTCTFPGYPGQIFSLLALPSASEITLQNCEFSMSGDTLLSGSTGLSNRFKSDSVHLSFSSGTLLFMRKN